MYTSTKGVGAFHVYVCKRLIRDSLILMQKVDARLVCTSAKSIDAIRVYVCKGRVAIRAYVCKRQSRDSCTFVQMVESRFVANVISLCIQI